MTTLDRCEPSLPADWYFDAGHYQRELDAIWYTQWICIGRKEEFPKSGDYRVIHLGTQQIVVTRDNDDWRAFHNTCRHRGSTLCENDTGHFRNGRVVCPYHVWTYSLAGELVATPKRLETDDFKMQDYSLYNVHIDSWGGFLFINLADKPQQTLAEFLGNEAPRVANWPLADMVSVHQDSHILECNWKIFWENYSECYHCPKMHPELCKIVPIYKEALIARSDKPGWEPEYDGDPGEPLVAEGMHTWSMDGQSSLPVFESLSAEEIAAGMTFATFAPTMFVALHQDYARAVHMLPRGPEQMELVVNWLVLPETRDNYSDEVLRVLELGKLVVAQDAKGCELNQRGLHSTRHQSGVLVPQEHGVWEFHEWVRALLHQK